MSEDQKPKAMTLRSRLERIGILVAIIVGLGGLITGTVSLSISYLTYKTSQEDAAKLYANKMVQVTLGNRTYVQNYGALPIFYVDVVTLPLKNRHNHVLRIIDSNDPRIDRNGPRAEAVRLGPMPPCSQIEITDLLDTVAKRLKASTISYIRFMDMNNVEWARPHSGVPSRLDDSYVEPQIDRKSLPIEPLPKCS